MKSELSSPIYSTRIYVSRDDASYRKVINETELEEILKKYGFQKVILSNKSIFEQAQLFNQAQIIISPHGAGLSNLAFCSPHTTVIELFSQDYINVCFWSIANLIRLNYWYLIGEQSQEISKTPSLNYKQSMIINTKKLSQLIETIIA